MNVRKANPNDAKSIAKVQVDSWKTTYKNIVPDEFLDRMSYVSREQKWKDKIPKQAVFVVETDEGEVVGFANGGKERTGNYPAYQGELYAIYILADYQRNGIGKLFIKQIIEELKRKDIYSMTVAVLKDNSSRKFYQSLGAKKIDTTELEISGEKLKEIIYGWEDIRTTF
ncbi:GNAT family N-acetyltransferase [Virgibacillus phasianinus]|uniref:GNAT family N-acetyltransferase n=1 Tax=Virgibacillus phasianinus TaxID=2017483 RepID=A0A220U7C9_9BACI|nr:GNAT family N-acetyltransferase [Virgibacillus phasianinus]ASK64027.1 GNAT family N-acetyltransferase [Virgibacillus phasianinus]